MKVTPNVASQVQNAGLNKSDSLQQSNKNEKGEKSSSATLGEIQSSSKVDISEAAQRLKMAQEIASKPDAINEAKVDKLQKLIDAGEYKVNADKVADRLVDEHLLMPS